MHAGCQRAHLRALQQMVDLFVHRGKIMLRRDLELNQADIIVAGNNTRAGAGSQHAFNAGRALVWRIAAAQL